MVQSVAILGAGSAGLLAALAFKRRWPTLPVRVVRCPELGTIGVGEGTTTVFPEFLFEYLKVDPARFYAVAQPIWKLGLRFHWGPRDHFFYAFSHQVDCQWNDLPRANGFYCQQEFFDTDLVSALMARDKVFLRQPEGGGPLITPNYGFHIENALLVDTLEQVARANGIEFIDGKVSGAERGDVGVTAVHLEDGRRLEADFFVDASGFRSELLGKTLEEPFVSYKNALFCDRAIVGGWERGPDEPILPYTTAETMQGGWAWQIEHEHFVNRGYVFSSDHTSDDEAREEFLGKNPKANKDGRVVKFRTGRHRRLWVDNVAAIGNAAGFVEPLEATALMMVCNQLRALLDMLGGEQTATPTLRALYNRLLADQWDEIRDFLALHYKFNTRLNTAFWQDCRARVDVDRLAPLLEFYAENGPNGFGRYLLPNPASNYGIEGFLVHLVGNRVPYKNSAKPTPTEQAAWKRHCQHHAAQARAGLDIRQALACVRDPRWQWRATA